MRALQPITRRIRQFMGTARHVSTLLKQDPEDRRYLTKTYDERVPLPAGAYQELSGVNPRLSELRDRYAALDIPAAKHVQWGNRASEFISDHLCYFRGDTPYVWHYRELPRVTSLKYLLFLKYIAEHDRRGLLSILDEDGMFGCWRFKYQGYPPVSRDLLDSINEIGFLDRHLNIFDAENLRILDIGAGYGRLAHRALTALPNISDYCCVDAVAESTFLCDYYLQFRNLMPRARVVPLDEVESSLQAGSFDLAINIHSFSECTFEAVSWWAGQLERLRIPRLLIIPNDADSLLTTEGKGLKRDFRPLIEVAGYRLRVCEPVFDDPALREALEIHDQFFLFERDSIST